MWRWFGRDLADYRQTTLLTSVGAEIWVDLINSRDVEPSKDGVWRVIGKAVCLIRTNQIAWTGGGEHLRPWVWWLLIQLRDLIMLSSLCCLVYPTDPLLGPLPAVLRWRAPWIFSSWHFHRDWWHPYLMLCDIPVILGRLRRWRGDPLSWRGWISGYSKGFSVGRRICPAHCLLSCPYVKLHCGVWDCLPLMCTQKSVLQSSVR